ncbi:MAG: phosphatase PAP2 family protein [Oscillospiraceae bacterium]|nr:phosphatase PAP2 family protein [Oscillospiraceae bacterium]
MRENGKKYLAAGVCLIAAFVIWTALIRCVDVRPACPEGTEIGLAAVNTWFHRLTGVHMALYTVTDWLGLVPVCICICFGILGAVQLVSRKSLFRVDADIILLGVYYAAIIFMYLLFETFTLNYRPVLIDGRTEPSYPSSTVLLVLGVMPTLAYQAGRRAGLTVRRLAAVFSAAFSVFMVLGRTLSGVHWLSDIIGSVLLSAGMFMMYRYGVFLTDRRRGRRTED